MKGKKKRVIGIIRVIRIIDGLLMTHCMYGLAITLITLIALQYIRSLTRTCLFTHIGGLTGVRFVVLYILIEGDKNCFKSCF